MIYLCAQIYEFDDYNITLYSLFLSIVEVAIYIRLEEKVFAERFYNKIELNLEV